MIPGRILFLGFGSVGQALAPALLRHWALPASRIMAIAADAEGLSVAQELGIEHQVMPLVRDNLDLVLSDVLKKGDLLVNVSVDVSSCSLIEWCQANGVLYLDTCVEPWAGGYVAGEGRNLEQTTNYALRQSALALRGKDRPTAVIAHGANPGVISHLAKEGLLHMANAKGVTPFKGPYAWARLAQALGVKVIQIAELDTQRTAVPTKEAFVNTWSVDGLLSEAMQPAECGWGTHEKSLPCGAHEHVNGSRCGIFLSENSAKVRMQSWVPSAGAQTAYLITHHEALSLAELLTLPGAAGPVYRPTTYYAYTPCEATQQSLARWLAGGLVEPVSKKVLRDELVEGADELGVLFVFDGGAFWYGSTVSIQEARKVSRFCNATSLQVVGGILGALDWMIRHPTEGVVEAEDLPHEELLAVARPFLGRIHGKWTSWQPQIGGSAEKAGLQFSDFRL